MIIRILCNEVLDGEGRVVKSVDRLDSPVGEILNQEFFDLKRGLTWWDADYKTVPQVGWALHTPSDLGDMARVCSISMTQDSEIFVHCDWGDLRGIFREMKISSQFEVEVEFATGTSCCLQLNCLPAVGDIICANYGSTIFSKPMNMADVSGRIVSICHTFSHLGHEILIDASDTFDGTA